MACTPVDSLASSFCTVLPIVVLVSGLLPISCTNFEIPWFDLVFKPPGFLNGSTFLDDSFCLRSVFFAIAAKRSLASTIFCLFFANNLFLASTTGFFGLVVKVFLFPFFLYASFPPACLPPCFMTLPLFFDTPERELFAFFVLTPFCVPEAFPAFFFGLNQR